jgi:uncharacterized protein YbjT (DUF2867 family)
VSVPEVLVTGGTGALGRRAVERFEGAGVGSRVLSRSGRPGTYKEDLITGEGLEQAVSGVDTIVNWLLVVAAGTGVSHLVYISIVGIDRVQSYPYYRVKLETERVIEGSPVLHTILRATQFYDLVLMAVRALARLPVVPVPKGLVGQPIYTGGVADRMVKLALGAPAGRVPDVGGPEVRLIGDAVRTYLEVTRMRKKFLEFPLPGKTARAMRGGALTCPENTYGRIRWEEFLRKETVGNPGLCR